MNRYRITMLFLSATTKEINQSMQLTEPQINQDLWATAPVAKSNILSVLLPRTPARFILFECAIDLLSYATLMKSEGKDWRQFNLVSLAGVYSPKQNIGDSKVPVTVRNLLEKDKSIKRIILHLDNDIAGRKATKALQTILSDKYEVVDDPPKCGKDVNDFLCIKLGISKKHERSFER